MKQRTPIRWDAGKSVVENVREVLPPMARELFAQGRRAASGKVKSKKLHELRLQAKRFRYTLELFQPLFGPAMTDRIGRLRRLQQRLGAISDCVATRNLLKDLSGKKTAKAKEVFAWLERREQEKIRQFLTYWHQTFDLPGEEERWVSYLRRYAGRRRRPGPPPG